MRRGNPDRKYGLHKIIYEYVAKNPGLRAKDIRYGEEVDEYIKANGYSRTTVSSYLNAMRKCGMINVSFPEPMQNGIYHINPARLFDPRIIQDRDRHYTAYGNDGNWDREAAWSEIDPTPNPQITDILSTMIRMYGAREIVKCLPEALKMSA
jgi:hypothetical protein